MTMAPDEPQDSRALADLTQLYCDGMARPTTAELDRGLDALFAHVAARKARRRRIVRYAMVGAAALAALVAVRLSSFIKRQGEPAPTSLAYRIDGGSVLEGGYLRESGDEGLKVRFNEGSTFALAPGTRGRLRAVNKDGARMAIEEGTAAFHITPSGDRRWLVDAGPFLVTVKGTVFSISWDPLGERFELSLQRGRVVVSGPVSAGEISLRAGQRVVVNLARAETLITEENAQQAAGALAAQLAESPTEQPAATGKAAAAPAPLTGRSSGERRWSDELARGHWDRILDDVKRAGVDASLAKASSDDLFALADAARYRRRPDLARAALLAERRRFPDSPRALDAIFLLGRVEESRERGIARAIAWYDEYLARAPSGPFVGEALGRKMTLTDKIQGAAAARPLAEDYLRRFPRGSYAGYARELIRSP